MSTVAPKIEFWFDPVCPWTWITSRWVADVAEQRGYQVSWQPFSLKILNDEAEAGTHKASHLEGQRLGRVIIAARRLYGNDVVGKLYTAMGSRLHHDQRRDYDAIITESLGEAEMTGQIDLAADDAEFDAELTASTREGIDRVGPGVGIPIISIDGVAFFGPVISPRPQGEAALTLWDGIRAAASIPGFFELKRGRDVGPIF